VVLEVGGEHAREADRVRGIKPQGRTTGTTLAFLVMNVCEGARQKDSLRIRQIDEIILETSGSRAGVDAQRVAQDASLVRPKTSHRHCERLVTPRGQEIGSCTLGVDVQFDHVFCMGQFGLTRADLTQARIDGRTLCEFNEGTLATSLVADDVPQLRVLWRSQPHRVSDLTQVSYSTMVGKYGLCGSRATFLVTPTPPLRLNRREAVLDDVGIKIDRISVHLPAKFYKLSPRAKLHCKFFTNPPGLLRIPGDADAPRSEAVVSEFAAQHHTGRLGHNSCSRAKWVWQTESIRDLIVRVPAHQMQCLEGVVLYMAFFEGVGAQPRLIGQVSVPLGRSKSTTSTETEYTITHADTLGTELRPLIKRGHRNSDCRAFVNCSLKVGKYQAIHSEGDDPFIDNRTELVKRKHDLLHNFPWLVKFSNKFDRDIQQRNTRLGHEKNFWRLSALSIVFLWLFLGTLFYRHSSGFTIPQAFCELQPSPNLAFRARFPNTHAPAPAYVHKHVPPHRRGGGSFPHAARRRTII
jgi:hypothetical protein